MIRANATVYLLVVLTAGLYGCGDNSSRVDESAAFDAFQAAKRASESGDAEEVISNVIAAVGGGLSPDDYEQALNLRAEAYARKGDFEAAMKDIEILKQGAADMASVYRTWSFVLVKKGDKAAAKKAFGLAKRLNPRLKPIKN